MRSDQHALVLSKNSIESSIVPLSFLKLAQIFIAHCLKVLHHLQFLEGVIFEIVDRRFHTFFAQFVLTEFEICDGFPEQGVSPPWFDFHCKVEKLDCCFEIA